MQLPPEDPEHERCKGKVLKFMYGLQKAAEGWEKHYTNVLEKMGGVVLARASSSSRKTEILDGVRGRLQRLRDGRPDLDWNGTRMQDSFELTF